MKNIINRLTAFETLTKEEAKAALISISNGEINPSHIVSFLTVYMMRTITVDELSGFRDALLELCIPVDFSDFDPIDLCGTGGDGKNTFNISTLSAFIVAGAGIKVAKHGNYGISSICGSSTVLEYLGVEFIKDEDRLKSQLDKAGICFLHAPLFHPALKNVGPIRKEMAMKTFFNMLGPLVNPSRPKKQLSGVYNLELLRLYSYLFQQVGTQFLVLHSIDGYDEITLTGEAKIISNTSEKLLSAEAFNFEKLNEVDLHGGSTIKEAASIFTTILEGKGTTAQKNVVYSNAGLAIHCYYPEIEVKDAVDIARDSLNSGKALQSFKALLNN
ncbi:MAG: anthranilate phosphoribosyltransferase [Flavobacteriales bacterium]|nr:anthranilate phosphoribosyltransferase [Flavobacteriales bacterium]